MSFSSTPAASPPPPGAIAASILPLPLSLQQQPPAQLPTPPSHGHTPTHTPQHSLSLQPSLEVLRQQGKKDDGVADELSGAFQQGLGISSRLGSTVQSPLEGSVIDGGLGLGSLSASGVPAGAQSIINEHDKNAVNTYFDQMQARIEAMRAAMLGDPQQAQNVSHELQQVVISLPAPAAVQPVVHTVQQPQPTPNAILPEGPSVRSSRSGSVSSFRKQHSASNSIDSSTSSPPLSFPYPTFSAPSIAGSARSLKRSASFSDWEEEEVDLDSGRLTKSMRMSDWYDEDDEDEGFGDARHFGQSPPQQLGMMNPQQQQQPQMPQLVHAHSFPSMHDLPSQNGATVHDQPLASPIPPRVPTISNATIVPTKLVSESHSKAASTKSGPSLSLSRLQHLQIDTSGTGAVGSVPASPVDYVPHPMPSFYPIQTWVDSLGQGYTSTGYDAHLGVEPFPTFGAEQDAYMQPGSADHLTFGGLDTPGSADPNYGHQGFFIDPSPMEGFTFTSPTMEWPPMQQEMNIPPSVMPPPPVPTAERPAPLEPTPASNGNGMAEAGTTPVPTSMMQQSQVAQQPMISDNRSAPSLSRSTSRISGVHKRPRKQASLSVVPKVTDIKPLFSPPVKTARSGLSSPTGGEIVPPAPPMAGILQQQQQATFNFSLLQQEGTASPSDVYSPAKVKSEVPSRPLSRQPSQPTMGTGVGAMDFADLSRRLGRSRRMSPVSSADGEDGDAEDEEDEVEAYVGGTGSRRASECGAGSKTLSRSSSSKRRAGEPHVISHANTIPSEMKDDVDRVFFDFLNKLCSNLEMTDSKGELIHQALMPKKMQKLDESPDFRPFKFRIQAFTNAFVEELNRQGFTEAVLPLKKVRTYLWSQPYISRYNEDGRKSKSKGNHIWNVHAKKLPENQGWVFREYQRKITGTPAGVAYIGLEWRWSPSIWDPQQSRSSMHPTFSSPSLPTWLQWKDNELVGTPSPGDKGGEVMAEASFPSETEPKVTHAFKLEVVELPQGEPLSLQKTRRPSAGTVSSSAPPVAGRNRSHTMSTAFTSESDVPPVPRIPIAITQAQQQENSQIRLVLEFAAAHIAQEATVPVAPHMPEAAGRQRQTSLAKQQEVLSRAVQAFNYVAFSLEPLPADFSELIAASKRVVKEAARQAAERQAQNGADAPVSISSIPMNDVIVTTRLLITKAMNSVGLQASELDIMRAATALIPQNGHVQPQPMAQPAVPQQIMPQQMMTQQVMPQQIITPPQPPPVAMPMTIDPAQLAGGIPVNGVSGGFQNLGSIHQPPDMVNPSHDMSSFAFPPPGASYEAQVAAMGQLPPHPHPHAVPHQQLPNPQ